MDKHTKKKGGDHGVERPEDKNKNKVVKKEKIKMMFWIVYGLGNVKMNGWSYMKKFYVVALKET